MTEEVEVKEKMPYEAYILLKPSILDTDISVIETKIDEVLQNNGAIVKNREKFTKKNLSYAIKKTNHGYAGTISFAMNAENLNSVEKEFKVSELPILRIMITKTLPLKVKKTRKLRETIEADKVSTVKEQKPLSIDENEKPKSDVKVNAEIKKIKSKDKVTLEDIDKRLDEIMENL